MDHGCPCSARGVRSPRERCSDPGESDVYRGEAPEACPRCGSRRGRYHSHGGFLRWLRTFVDGRIDRIRLRKPRYLCLTCHQTFSLDPPEVLPYKRYSSFLIVLCLWSYLVSMAGMHHCLPGAVSEDISARTVARHLSLAKALAVETQQAIREVLIRKTEPRPVEDLFPGGLDPRKVCVGSNPKNPTRPGRSGGLFPCSGKEHKHCRSIHAPYRPGHNKAVEQKRDPSCSRENGTRDVRPGSTPLPVFQNPTEFVIEGPGDWR